jgi:hypothetical protein
MVGPSLSRYGRYTLDLPLSYPRKAVAVWEGGMVDPALA